MLFCVIFPSPTLPPALSSLSLWLLPLYLHSIYSGNTGWFGLGSSHALLGLLSAQPGGLLVGLDTGEGQQGFLSVKVTAISPANERGSRDPALPHPGHTAD